MPRNVPTFAKFDAKRQAAYLRRLEEGDAYCVAAKEAGVSYELVRQFRHKTPGWAAREKAAERQAVGLVEKSLFQQAREGNMTAVQVYLYNRAPRRWRDRRNLTLGGPKGGPVELVVKTLGGGGLADEL